METKLKLNLENVKNLNLNGCCWHSAGWLTISSWPLNQNPNPHPHPYPKANPLGLAWPGQAENETFPQHISTCRTMDQYQVPKWHPSDIRSSELGAGAVTDLSARRDCEQSQEVRTKTASENSFAGDPLFLHFNWRTNNKQFRAWKNKWKAAKRANSTCVQLIIVKKSKLISNSTAAAAGAT